MMLAMNLLGYDAMTLGNHEFNFGLKNLEKTGSDARFSWLSPSASGSRPAEASGPSRPTSWDGGGVKVAVSPSATPAIPGWESQRIFAGTGFRRRLTC